MAKIQFEGRVSAVNGEPLYSVSSLEIAYINNAAFLLVATGQEGSIASFALNGTGRPVLVDTYEFTSNVSVGVGRPLSSVQTPDGTLVLGGQSGSNQLEAVTLSAGGQLSSAAPVWGFGSSNISWFLNTGSHLVTASFGSDSLSLASWSGSGAVDLASTLQDSTQSHIANLSSLTLATVQGATILLTGSASEQGISSFTLDSENLSLADTIGPESGLGIMSPTAIEVATLHGTSYAIVASAPSSGTSGALSVMQLSVTGQLTPTDHIQDTYATQFGGVSAMDVIELSGQIFIAAAGADGGITLLQLAPDGQLVHLTSLEPTAEVPLLGINDLELSTQGGTLQIYVSTMADAGFTILSTGLSALGSSQTGTAQANTLSGTGLRDMLSGGSGDDVLFGHGGDDVLLGGEGSDTLHGGAGRDIFVIAADGAEDLIADFDASQDTIDLSNWPQLYAHSQLTVTLNGNTATLSARGQVLTVQSATQIHIQQLLDAIVLPVTRNVTMPSILEEGSSAADVLTGDWGPDTLLGHSGNDALFGEAGSDSLSGGAGDDTLAGGAGGDWLDGGTGNDSLRGEDSSDSLAGGDGNDWLAGGRGDDSITGGEGDDTAFGDSGNDTLIGGAGADMLDGGEGDDSLAGADGNDSLTGGSGADTLNGGTEDDTLRGGLGDDLVIGGEGFDTAYIDSVFSSGGVSFDTAGNFVFSSAEGIDTYIGVEQFVFTDRTMTLDALIGQLGLNLVGTASSDKLTGGNFSDTLDGKAGNDSLIGGAGDDTIIGGEGSDTLEGGAGADLIEGGDGNDRLLGGDHDDLMFGGNGDDYMSGDAGNDRFYGEDGNDMLVGGAGDDILFGASDDDTLLGGDGNDTLLSGRGIDMLWGGAGDDRLEGGGWRDTLYGEDGDDRLLAGRGLDYVTGGPGDDSIAGGRDNDTLHGDDGNDTIEGGGFRDLVFGGTGDDILLGGNGKDTLNGGSGRDTLDGGKHDDILIGGGGADSFVFGAGSGHDEIRDFEDGRDRLVIEQSLWQGLPDTDSFVTRYAEITSQGILFDFGSLGSLRLDDHYDLSTLADSIIFA